MELFSLHSPPAAIRPPPCSSRRVLMEKSVFFSGQVLTFSDSNKRCPTGGSVRFIRPQAAGSFPGTSGSALKATENTEQGLRSKDSDLVFVAGATGRVGSRTVRELLKLGFRVRAGVRSAQRAEGLVQSVHQMKLDDASGIQHVEKLEIVECDLEKQGEIGPAIGNASIMICCIGASEKEIFDVTGPYRIDYMATKNLINAATVAKVDHFILLTSLGTNKIGFPAAILNLFWGVLYWKRKAEEALLASGLPYTIVRPGGMERPTDAFKETHNLLLASEDTYFGGLVSNLQVAELMAFMARNRSLSFCKVVEVIAETTAPLTPMGDLLAEIPSQRVDTSPLEEVQAKPKQAPTSPPIIESKSTSDVPDKEPIQTEVQKTRPLSPFVAYDGLKPPASPSPNAPSTSSVISKSSESDSKIFSMAASSESESPVSEESGYKEDVKPQKPRPLSPFTMYEDLKPPSSPIPSLPKY